MSSTSNDDRFFFVVGPLRTGSSLMARCLDDHPAAICLCESEINRALFRDYCIAHHCNRMRKHGLALQDAVVLLDGKKQDDIESLFRWYREARSHASRLYGKPEGAPLGDKSPDYYRSPELAAYLAESYPLIYTIRDPRAILYSIDCQADASLEAKADRWQQLVNNYSTWKPYLDAPNVLPVRYEDVVANPLGTMASVYAHLNLPSSRRFAEKFPRAFPERFLWRTAVNWQTGVSEDFDRNHLWSWKTGLTEAQIDGVRSHPIIAEFMERFGYDEADPPGEGRFASPAPTDASHSPGGSP